MGSQVIEFSVIIPHKNNTLLLQRCLNSIPRCDSIQIIVVDDNSNPMFVKFEEFPCLHDTYVQLYFTKEGKGAGYARNVGLKYARGKWVIFADADDFFTEDAFESFRSQYYNTADIIYFRSRSIYNDTKEIADRANIYNLMVVNYLNKSIDESRIRTGFHVPWAKMIRRTLIEQNRIQFDEVPAANDVYFSVLSGLAAKEIDACLNTVYVVTVSRGSITRRKNFEISFSQYYVNLRRNKLLKSMGMKKEQHSILYKYLECLKYKPLKILYLTWLLIRFRQNPFINWRNWYNTFFDIKRKNTDEKRYFTK